VTGVELAGLLKEYGWPGACAVLCLVVAYLHKGWQGCQEARIVDAKLGTEALTRQASTNTETAAGMQALRDGQVEIMRIVSLIQRDAENFDDRTQERIEGLTRAIDEFGRRLDHIPRVGAR
jgi:hypothetical protein